MFVTAAAGLVDCPVNAQAAYRPFVDNDKKDLRPNLGVVFDDEAGGSQDWVFDRQRPTRQKRRILFTRREADVRDFIDSRAEIVNWTTVTLNSFVIVSAETSVGLTRIFGQQFRRGRFLVVDMSFDANGRVPGSVWSMINEPKRFDE